MLGVVLKEALVAVGVVRDRVEFESWERVARVACWLVEMMDFHILLGEYGYSDGCRDAIEVVTLDIGVSWRFERLNMDIV